MTTVTRVFRCQHPDCDQEYPNPIARAQHARRDHPGLPTAAPKWLRSGKVREKRPSLRRDTDTWPGRP